MKILLIVIGLMLALSFNSFLVLALWNCSIGVVFHAFIDFWQAIGIYLLSQVFIGEFGATVKLREDQ